MKVVKLTGIRQMEIIESPIPEIVKDIDVLIRMTSVGICGSDIHYYATGRIGSQVVEYPFTVGHEGAGIVEEVGDAVTSVKPGDRIAVEPSISCGVCDQCKSGRPHTCRNNLFLGCPGQIEGNLTEYLIMPESQCLKIKDKQTFDEAVLSEPLSIGLYANKQANYEAGQSIAILGFGPIGMSVLLCSKATNPGTYYVSEKIEERIVLAKKNGADWTGNPLKESIDASIFKVEPDLMDVVFECCGQQDALDTAIEIVKPGGKVLIVGIPEFDRWSFKADLARRKEITIIHVRRQNNCVHDVLKLMEEGKVDAQSMITHRFNLDQTQEAFEMVHQYKDGVMKVMIDFN